jgi:hypothetical protein
MILRVWPNVERVLNDPFGSGYDRNVRAAVDELEMQIRGSVYRACSVCERRAYCDLREAK